MENKKASKGEWQVYVETLLDCGVSRVQCTPCVTQQQITVTPDELYPPSNVYQLIVTTCHCHSDNFGNFLRRLEFAFGFYCPLWDH
jgi:hypothetical protein